MFCLLLVESGFSGSRISVGISSGQQQRLCKKSSTGASLPRPRKQTASKEQKQNTNGGDWFDELFQWARDQNQKKKPKEYKKDSPRFELSSGQQSPASSRVQIRFQFRLQAVIKIRAWYFFPFFFACQLKPKEKC